MKQFRRYILAIALVSHSAVAWAQTLNVTLFNAPAGQGGVNIQADWDLGSNPWCNATDVRWLQRVQLKNPDGTTNNGVPGYPSGEFIDPLPTQPGGPWDNNPWYDVTYNTAANRASDTNRQGGAGRFYNDSPAGWGPFGPLTFCAWTAVVCINTENSIATYIGGFTWSFTVGATGGITSTAPAALSNTAATTGLFNGSLQNGPASFRSWTLNTGDPNCQLTFVPEPASMIALGLGVAAMLRRRRRK